MSFFEVFSPVGIVAFGLLGAIFCIASKRCILNGMSMPSIMALTSIAYFFVFPLQAARIGFDHFLGIELSELYSSHLVSILYAGGAAVAFFCFRRQLLKNPEIPRQGDGKGLNPYLFGVLCLLALTGLVYQVATEQLFLTSSQSNKQADLHDMPFITEVFNLMIPLTVVWMIRRDFKWSAWAFFVPVLYVFLQVGFRFRMLILICAVLTSFCLVRKIRVSAPAVLVGAAFGLLILNFVGGLRTYGLGLNLERLEDKSLRETAESSEGEFGVTFVTESIASRELPPPIYAEPWIVGLTILVPRVVWPDKPTAHYINDFSIYATSAGAEFAGIAALQHIEMLYQFGWAGVPILSFLYFSFATFLLYRISRLGRETRIAGCAMVPAFFGYYMQSRGYFAQIFTDGLFLFGPLFVMHWRLPTLRSRTN